MNAHRLQTFKSLLNIRIERAREDLRDGYLEQDEFNMKIAELLGSVITRFNEHEEVTELTRLFTKDEVIGAFGLEEQHA